MPGNLIGSIVIGISVAVALYLFYGLERFRPMAGTSRARSAVLSGAIAAVVGFLLRWAGWF